MQIENYQSISQDEIKRAKMLLIAFVIMFVSWAAMGILYIIKCEKYNGTLPIVNNTLANLGALKKDCEKDLPRSKECVMVYDFVAVNKE